MHNSKLPLCRIINPKCFLIARFPLIKSENELQIQLPIQKSDKIFKLSIDTGAQISILYPYKLDPNTIVNVNRSIQIQGIVQNSSTKSEGVIEANIFHDDMILTHEFHLIKGNSTPKIDGILGHDFFDKYKANINYQNNSLKLHIFHYLSPPSETESINDTTHIQSISTTSFACDEWHQASKDFNTYRVLSIIKSPESSHPRKKINNPRFYDEMANEYLVSRPGFTNIVSHEINRSEFCPHRENFVTLNSLRRGERIESLPVTDKDERIEILRSKLNTDNLNDKQIKMIELIISKFNKVFYIKNDPITHTKVVEHVIKLIPNSKPVYTKQYRTPQSQVEEVKKHIADLLIRKIIEPSTSPFNSPIFLVDKEDESGMGHRLVVNFQKVNAITQPMDFPVVVMEEIFDRMANAKVFTTLDVKSAYFHIPLHKDSRPYTAFTFEYNKYQFRSSAFGLVGSGYFWQMAFCNILGEELTANVMSYVDDVIIFTEDEVTNVRVTKRVLSKLGENNILVSIEKAKFLQKSVKFLSHIFSADGILPDPKRTEAIDKFPRPTNLKEVQRVLGLANYYRRFVPNFSEICKPLHRLTKKSEAFAWTEDCEKAFTTLKQILVSPTVLMYPRFDMQFNLCVDASNVSIGAVLSQSTAKRSPYRILQQVAQ